MKMIFYLVGLAGVLVSGCSSIKPAAPQSRFSVEQLAAVKVGMTLAEVEAIMPGPNQVTTNRANGVVTWRWQYREAGLDRWATVLWTGEKVSSVPSSFEIEYLAKRTETDADRQAYLAKHPDLGESERRTVEEGLMSIGKFEQERKERVAEEERSAARLKAERVAAAKARSDYVEAHPGLPREELEAIAERRILMGMNQEQVLLVKGREWDRITTSESASGKCEMWWYGDYEVFTFMNGRLVNWTH